MNTIESIKESYAATTPFHARKWAGSAVAVAKPGTPAFTQWQAGMKLPEKKIAAVVRFEWITRAGFDSDPLSQSGTILRVADGHQVMTEKILITALPDGSPDWDHFTRDGGKFSKFTKNHRQFA